MKRSDFHQTVSKLLESKLQTFNGQDLTRATCLEIYVTIFDTLADVVSQAQTPLGNESVNWISQAYYDAAAIKTPSGIQELDPNVFEKHAKLENIETKELALMAVMFNGTDFAIPLLHEIKKRS